MLAVQAIENLEGFSQLTQNISCAAGTSYYYVGKKSEGQPGGNNQEDPAEVAESAGVTDFSMFRARYNYLPCTQVVWRGKLTLLIVLFCTWGSRINY